MFCILFYIAALNEALSKGEDLIIVAAGPSGLQGSMVFAEFFHVKTKEQMSKSWKNLSAITINKPFVPRDDTFTSPIWCEGLKAQGTNFQTQF